MLTRGTLAISNSTENLPKVRSFVLDHFRKGPLPKSEENKIILAVDEAVANIIEHGYPADVRDGKIEVEIVGEMTRFTVYVRDEGSSFDPNSISDVDIENHIKTGKKKGLGVFLMRKIMDEVVYHFEEGKMNELKLVRYVPEKKKETPSGGGGQTL
ncbi:MAG: ATP-binding protein [Planctomycetes bacterium]|nr:ATP-binding protein [Planctomycetota bacterium]